MAQGKLSDYIGTMRNGTYISPERAQKHLEENTSSQNDALFAKVFPLPNYYGVEPVQGGFNVTTYESRTKAADAKNKNSDLKTYRDFFIMDTEAFEAHIDKNMDEVGYKRMPANIGRKKPASTGFASAEYLASLSPEAAAQYAAELAAMKLSKPKRTVPQSTIDAMHAARRKKGQEDTPTKSTAAKGGAKRK